MERFFLIWDNDSARIHKKHYTIEEAEKESERLMFIDPNKKFTILMSLKTIQSKKEFEWNYNDQKKEIENAPF